MPVHPILELLATPEPEPPRPPSTETLAIVTELFSTAWTGRYRGQLTRAAYEGAILAACACTNPATAERIQELAIANVIEAAQEDDQHLLAQAVVPTLERSSQGWSVSTLEYLAATEGLPPGLSLRHVEVANARVRLGSTQLQSLIQFHVKQMCPLPARGPPEWVAQAYARPIAQANRTHAEQRRRIQAAREHDRQPSAYPPCIRLYLGKLQQGLLVNHHERFNLVAFLHMFGASSGEIVALFRDLPGYSESTTEYQVAHITGKKNRTGPSGYAPMGCRQMRDLRICPDSKCRGPTPALLYARTLSNPKRPGAP